MHAVILAGGVGSRLWPVSTKQKPKPFINVDNENLIQKAFIRANKIESVYNIITVTTSDYLPAVKNSYSQIIKSSDNNITQELIVEPCGRDTAAAIAAAAAHIFTNYGPDEMILILPSDHIISDTEAFSRAVLQAQDLALQGKIVTFGIKPFYPEIGYGYIEHNGNEVIRFVEKPSFSIAMDYLKSKKFLWNSGILCFTSQTIIRELEIHCSDLLSIATEAIYTSVSSSYSNYREVFLNTFLWNKIPKISIDYVLLEKSNQISVISCDIGWSDVGNWQSMSRVGAEDENGNKVRGNVTLYDSTNCYVESDSNKIIAVIGARNLAIIETENGFLVIDKSSASIAKELFAELQEKSELQ
jgi:mannose-1-phosphate guanylyltransferase/mannose-6-phosphate isomerase